MSTVLTSTPQNGATPAPSGVSVRSLSEHPLHCPRACWYFRFAFTSNGAPRVGTARESRPKGHCEAPDEALVGSRICQKPHCGDLSRNARRAVLSRRRRQRHEHRQDLHARALPEAGHHIAGGCRGPQPHGLLDPDQSPGWSSARTGQPWAAVGTLWLPGPAPTDLWSRAHADQPPPDRFRDRSSAHVRAPIDGIEPVMSARAAAVSPVIVAVARSRRSASVPGEICTNHWPRSSRTSVTDDPAPLDTLEVRARHAASEGAHRTLRYQRAALPAGQFSMTPTVSYPSRS